MIREQNCGLYCCRRRHCDVTHPPLRTGRVQCEYCKIFELTEKYTHETKKYYYYIIFCKNSLKQNNSKEKAGQLHIYCLYRLILKYGKNNTIVDNW